MADQFDQAQDLDAYYRQQALEVWQQETRRNSESSLINTHCEDCGDEIPAGRRAGRPRLHTMQGLPATLGERP